MRKVMEAMAFWRAEQKRLQGLLAKPSQNKCFCFKQRNGDHLLLLLLLLYLIIKVYCGRSQRKKE